jgi:hypothetical protein
MSNAPTVGYMLTNAVRVKFVMTKDELRDILDSKLDPLIKIVEDHETILRGSV